MVNIQSPCIRNCCLDEQDICLGCYRSIDEILQWAEAPEQKKREIVELANTRRLDYQLKYLGRTQFGCKDSKD